MLVLAGLVVAAVLVVVVTVAVGRADRHPTVAAAQNQPGPVLLVPGYGGSTNSLTKLAAVLRSHGRTAEIVSLPGNGTGDLKAQARTLAAAAKTILARTGAVSVDVVGYSAGGVTARLWLRDDGGAAVTRRMVTLGSPQHGTDLATLGSSLPGSCPVACQQLDPDSGLLRDLNAGDETPNGPQYVSVWTTADQVVVPPDSARLDGAIGFSVQSVCASSKVSHTELPTDPLVTAIVVAELDGTTTSALTAADCSRLSS
jgi:triacylglycerol lipase